MRAYQLIILVKLLDPSTTHSQPNETNESLRSPLSPITENYH